MHAQHPLGCFCGLPWKPGKTQQPRYGFEEQDPEPHGVRPRATGQPFPALSPGDCGSDLPRG